MPTIFTKIIKGEIPCYKIAENEKFFAFLDINPLSKGHTLVVPKVETDYFFDLESEMLSDIMIFSKNIAHALDKTMDCKRTAIAVVGLEVPHAHVHLIPLKTMSDFSFAKPKLKLTKEEFEEIAAKIIAAL
jgi:histidine triad (HIT) family protein